MGGFFVPIKLLYLCTCWRLVRTFVGRATSRAEWPLAGGGVALGGDVAAKEQDVFIE
ncbi:hypothetical protein GCM10011375_32030 [Hymenobacter qilianensis]|uniref:Uncharacterized protein n=1 Tax=Hymenobacter qilianensis TaxID=1385715 RepID=A0ACB5PV06_9BACT|nr:hypothetical protein GCM10011375_32030 [Hymenobacter qilianensis]